MENQPKKPWIPIFAAALVLIWNFNGPGSEAVELIGVLVIFFAISVYHARKKDFVMMILSVILGLLALFK